MKTFLETIWRQGDVREIRAFDAQKYVYYGYFDCPKKAEKAIAAIEKNMTVYVTINPVNPEFTARVNNRIKKFIKKDAATKDEDVIHLDYLLVDLDPKRPSEMSSTDAELQHARELSETIKTELGKPLVYGMSGNGFHLIYRHDAKDATQVKAFLEALAEKHGQNGVDVDTKVFNPSRITKVLGTWARKGDNVPVRPWRKSYVIEINEDSPILAIPKLPPPEVKSEPTQKNKYTERNQADQIQFAKDFASQHGINIIGEKTRTNGTVILLQEECVFNSDHKGGDSGICVATDCQITYHCFHKSCGGHTWQDLRARVGDPARQSQPKTCNKCGFEGKWLETADGWRIATEDGVVHDCPGRKRKTKKKTDQQHETKPGLPIITVIPGMLHETVSLAEKTLIDANAGVYQRNGLLVRVVQSKKPPRKGIKREEKITIITVVEPTWLCEKLTSLAKWQKEDARSKSGFKDIDCPLKIADTLIARGSWNFQHLNGVINAPTLRADGSILENPGYDIDTCLLYEPNAQYLKIPENPTREDAEEALARLYEIVREFPFVDKASRSVFFSAAMTACIRRSLRVAPAHAFGAPKMGNGKTLLADIASLIATGKLATKITKPEGAEEEKKVFMSLLMEGDPCICIDNIDDSYASDALCTILTEEEWGNRLLGFNKTPKLPTNATWFMTGNNIRLSGDLSARAILATIDAQVERPDERTFTIKNIRDHILQHRAEIVNDCLTILRAYHQAGRPDQHVKQHNRFPDWSDWVRSAIIWASDFVDVGPDRQNPSDPCLTREKIESEDPTRIGIGGLLQVWYNVFGSSPVQIKDVIKKASENEDLQSALVEFASDKSGHVNAKGVAWKIRKFKGRIEGGLKIIQGATMQRAVLWKVIKNEQDQK